MEGNNKVEAINAEIDSIKEVMLENICIIFFFYSKKITFI